MEQFGQIPKTPYGMRTVLLVINELFLEHASSALGEASLCRTLGLVLIERPGLVGGSRPQLVGP
jgi:hypothetical protein